MKAPCTKALRLSEWAMILYDITAFNIILITVLHTDDYKENDIMILKLAKDYLTTAA